MEHNVSGLTIKTVSTSKGCDTTLTDLVLRHAANRKPVDYIGHCGVSVTVNTCMPKQQSK